VLTFDPWLVADGWCWFVLREEYCWLVAGGCFVLREKYCWLVAGGCFVLREKYYWLVADKPSEQGPDSLVLTADTPCGLLPTRLTPASHSSLLSLHLESVRKTKIFA
jgi:hypothetical protein